MWSVIYNRGVERKLIYFFITVAMVAAVFGFARVPAARAAESGYVSDTIIDSRLSWPTNHTIIFEVPSGIPASGRLVIDFQNKPFLIDPSFSYADVDLAVSDHSPTNNFAERSLAAVPDAVNDGVDVTPVTGPITITLSSGAGISAGSFLRIELGTNAPGGTYQISNPSSTASYRIFLNTYDAASKAIDYGAAMVAILPSVGVDVNQNRTVPAMLSNGMPSGTIPSNILGVLVSFNTDVYASCRYSTSSGVAYSAMVNTTADNAQQTFHTFVVMGITQGETYTFYARCHDFAGNENQSDYAISFTAGQPTGTGLGGGAAGSSGGGGGANYPAAPSTPTLVISGFTIPNATMAVLEDGAKISVNATANSAGQFSINVSTLTQGTHSFTVQAVDGGGAPLATYTATITLVSGTTNSINGVVLPPTISFATSTSLLGKAVAMSGSGTPSSLVDMIVTSQANVRAPFEATTTVSSNGAWTYKIPGVGFPMDTYQIKVRAMIPGLAASSFSPISFLGIGEAVNPKLKIGDLNGDGKVNLVDFSIMLAHWATKYAPADLNNDGTVNLPDLSILLSHWTG